MITVTTMRGLPVSVRKQGISGILFRFLGLRLVPRARRFDVSHAFGLQDFKTGGFFLFACQFATAIARTPVIYLAGTGRDDRKAFGQKVR